MRSSNIPIASVGLGRAEERLVLDVLRSGQLAQGPMVERLESQFTQVCGVSHAIAVSSGTTALVAALQALDLRPGDEVLTTPFTFAATLNAIIEAGATARFVDIDLDDFNLDADLLASEINDRTRAIMPVHLYGLACRMGDIESIAKERGLRVVEDAAQALGATVGRRAVGSYDLGCFSLYATKNVTAGEGGVITTGDDELADRLRVLRNQGMRGRYEYLTPGHNYRLTDLQAAVAIPQVDRIDEINESRQQNAVSLNEMLSDIPGLVTPTVPSERSHVFHQYTVRVTPEAQLDRDVLARRLAQSDVGTGIFYPRPVFDYACYRAHPQVIVSPVPRAERAAREVLSLPVHPHLTRAQLQTVAMTIRSLLV